MLPDTEREFDRAAVPALTEDDVRRIVRAEVERAFARDPGMRRAAIVASKGTLDWAYPPLILGNAAAAVGMEVSIFFTFYGLNIIHRDFARKLKIDPVGNPAMPMPVPIPDILGALPGMVPLASTMMRSRFAKHHVATIAELLDSARDVGVRLIACQMTVDVFGYCQGDFVDGVEFGGAAAFMAEARRSHVTMFISGLPFRDLARWRPFLGVSHRNRARSARGGNVVRLLWRCEDMQDITEDQLVDARDLMCPMPVMAAAKAMRRLGPNQVLKILATDRGATSDIPAWAESVGGDLLASTQDGGVFVFYVRKAREA